MGVAILAAYAVLFAGGVAAGASIFAASLDYEAAYESAAASFGERMLREAQSSIEIAYVQGSKIYVKNAGSLVLDPNYVYLVLDEAWQPSSSYSISGLGYIATAQQTKLVKAAVYDGSTLTLKTQNQTDVSPDTARKLEGIVGWFNITAEERSFVATNTSSAFNWKPGEVIEITTSASIGEKVKVAVETGASDEYRTSSKDSDHLHAAPVLEGYGYAWS